jgi:adenylate cyclase
MDLNMSKRSEQGRGATGDTTNISAWLMKEGLSGATQTTLLQGFCERLVAAGLPLHRAHVGQRALHPVFGAVGFDWHRDGGRATREDYARVSEPLDRWLKSPFYYLLQKGMPELRERLLDGNEPSRFPVLEEYRVQGATDYFASAMLFGQATIGPPTDPDDPPEGMISSWTSDAPRGFSDGDIGTIRELLPVLGLALKSASSYRTARDLLAVYLGRDAGERVLSGDIQRGSLDTIRAVIWYFDLRGFTKLSETTPGEQMIAMLNDYFGAAVGAVEAYGGESGPWKPMAATCSSSWETGFSRSSNSRRTTAPAARGRLPLPMNSWPPWRGSTTVARRRTWWSPNSALRSIWAT